MRDMGQDAPGDGKRARSDGVHHGRTTLAEGGRTRLEAVLAMLDAGDVSGARAVLVELLGADGCEL
jgi:hypothetical protein